MISRCVVFYFNEIRILPLDLSRALTSTAAKEFFEMRKLSILSMMQALLVLKYLTQDYVSAACRTLGKSVFLIHNSIKYK
jgi:hypothetical protein